MDKKPDWTKLTTRARKFAVALVGLVANAVAAGVVPDEYVPYAVALISLATALGVYNVPNERI